MLIRFLQLLVEGNSENCWSRGENGEIVILNNLKFGNKVRGQLEEKQELEEGVWYLKYKWLCS